MSKHKYALAAVLSLCCASALADPQFIAASIFSQNDPFMKNYALELQRLAQTSDLDFKLYYAQEDLVKEQQQLQLSVRNGAAALIINPIEPHGVYPLISAAHDAGGLPLVFINRKPDDHVLRSYNNCWYVGSDPGQAGRYQAEILTQYCLDNPQVDRNGDGQISYFLLQGEKNLADTVMRTMAVRDSFKTSPVTFTEAGAAYANWDFGTAHDVFEQYVRINGIDSVEAVISNNDAMALGALQYLKSIGFNGADPQKHIPVLGIDGIEEAVKAVQDGQMAGTVRNDYYTQAQAAYKIAYLAAKGEKVDASAGFYMVNGKEVYVPYIKITAHH